MKKSEAFVGIEKHLHRNGTRIIPFYLDISKEEYEQLFSKSEGDLGESVIL